MTDLLATSVIRDVFRGVKARGGALTEEDGQALASLSVEDLQLLQAASELVERRAVKRVTAVPSQRSFCRVESLNRYHHHQPHQSVMTTDSQPGTGGDPSGASFYNCFDHFCSCATFLLAASKSPTSMCKHMIAALLADATGQSVAISVADADLPKMLCPSIGHSAPL
ncbi:hypothetical protein P43SY_000855 [Pythium insidiosum]|uniref:SWIM-type domain-containing protein n=1 Tax=Pythium insidiosum TaxID=114742 RepID=A0AAD5Q7N1_PYTIN|nr:hypothetical protein P43SY_000855 [Pythium insidiosum]